MTFRWLNNELPRYICNSCGREERISLYGEGSPLTPPRGWSSEDDSDDRHFCPACQERAEHDFLSQIKGE